MRTISAILAAACLATPVPAATIVWKEVGPWTIRAYDFDKGCSADTVFDQGTRFYIGFDMNDAPSLELLMFDDKWASIRADRTYEIKVFFGNESPWTLEMTGMNSDDDSPGLSFRRPLSDDSMGLFAEEFMREQNMRWYFGDALLGNLSLRGSRQALNEAISCTKSYADALAKADPFAGTGGVAGDPFAR